MLTPGISDVDYTLTTDALRRMILRDITEEVLIAALERPYATAPGRTSGTLIHDAIVNGRGIRVVVLEGTDPIRIVAVMARRVPRAR